MKDQIEKLEALELEARSSGDTRRAERLKDEIERLKRITSGINFKFQHQEYKKASRLNLLRLSRCAKGCCVS